MLPLPPKRSSTSKVSKRYSLANMLNGTTSESTYGENTRASAMLFTAPSVKLLIVDDVNTNLTVATGLMSPYKMRIDTCISGAEAINMVKKNRYDIIFMDHMMPEMDGVETTQAIRSLPDDSEYYKNVPIIALTANAVSGIKEMFLQNGMNDFLEKPIKIRRLDDMLRKWIPKERREKYESEITVSETISLAIEGVDIGLGLSLNGNIMENYLKTLGVFYRDGRGKIENIHECLRNNDIKLYTTLVHGLKSSAMSIGAKDVSEYAKALEIAGKSNDSLSFIFENNDDFLGAFETLLNNIGAVINSDGVSAVDPAQLDFLKETLAKLKSAFESIDAVQMNALVKDLQGKRWDKTTTALIEHLSKCILLFDYEEGVTLIDDFFKRGNGS